MKRETRIAGIRRLLRLPASRRSIARDLDDEIRFHLESRVRELIERGMAPEIARAEAEREFGDLSSARREIGEVDRRRLARDRRTLFLDSLRQDLRYAFRGLRRQPGFTAVVVATLTLGIGANAVVFGLVDRLLLRAPAHVLEPDRVTRIYMREQAPSWAGGDLMTTTITTYPMVVALRENVPAFAEISAFFRGRYTLGRGVDAQELDVSLVDGNFFRLLGTRPALGRFFTPEEDALPTGTSVAILSHGFWERHFGGRASALDSTLVIDGRTFDVIGVAPRGFNGIDLNKIDVWVPTSTMAAANFGNEWHEKPNSLWAQMIARLAPGATHAQAEAQATVAYRRELASWNQSWRDSTGTIIAGSLIAARGPQGASREAKVSVWLLGVSVIVLLIACANIANLLLARAMRRRREIAVRLALGVGRVRLARQLVTEALLLAGLAAAVALLVAHWGGALVRGLLLPSIAWTESPVDQRVLLFTMAAAMLTGVLAGLAPAFQSMRTDVSASLRTGGREGGGRRAGLRGALLVAQAALSVILLVGAGLFVRSLHNVRGLDVGIDLERTLLVRTALNRAGFGTERIQEVYRQALERARAMPGVESATLVSATVPMRSANALDIRIPGRDSVPELPNGGPYYSGVGGDFFRTIGARVVRGRAIDEGDVRAGARVMLINETVAEHYWPNENPVGQCVTLRDEPVCTEIIGIVQNVLLFRMMNDERGLAYVPISHPIVTDRPPGALLVRTTEHAPLSPAVLRREIQSLAPNMPYVAIQSYAELVAPELQPWRLGATMFGIFGAVALLIAAVGLYSVIAYLVAQRTHEIGVRMALGARRRQIVRLVLGEGMRVAVVGLSLGIVAALIAGRWVAELLYETSPRDPAILAAVTVTLGLVAAAAALVPSWRASRVDPATALRAE